MTNLRNTKTGYDGSYTRYYVDLVDGVYPENRVFFDNIDSALCFLKHDADPMKRITPFVVRRRNWK
jgi:hypothetical protein